MCSIAESRFASPVASGPANRSVMTFCPLSAANVSGVTNSRAPRVITTCTLNPSCWRRRTSSAALYAATPPVTPSVMRMVKLRCALFLLLAFAVFRVRGVVEFVFDHVVIDFFAGKARIFKCTRIIHKWRCACHQLPGAACRKHDISKLALRGFRLHGHLSLSLQMTPEDSQPRHGGARWNTAVQSQSLQLPALRD